MKERRFMKLALFGFTLFLGIRGIIAGPSDTPILGDVSMLTISGYILAGVSGIGITAWAYNSLKAEK